MVQPPSGSGSETTSITWPLLRMRRAVAGCERSAPRCAAMKAAPSAPGELVTAAIRSSKAAKPHAAPDVIRRQAEQFGEARIGEQQGAGRAECGQPELQRRQRRGGLGQRALPPRRGRRSATWSPARKPRSRHPAAARCAGRSCGRGRCGGAAGPARAAIGRQHGGNLRLGIAGAVDAAMGGGAHRVLHRRAGQDAAGGQVQRRVERRVHEARCRLAASTMATPTGSASSTGSIDRRRRLQGRFAPAHRTVLRLRSRRERAPQRVQQHQRGGQQQHGVGLVGRGEADRNHQQQRRNAQAVLHGGGQAERRAIGSRTSSGPARRSRRRR